MISAIAALAGLWILLGAVWLAVYPFFRGEVEPVDDAEVELHDLSIEKERLLQQIHELELDWETGKLSEEDYRALDARLRSRAVEVMREIDEHDAAGLERRSRGARKKREKAEVDVR